MKINPLICLIIGVTMFSCSPLKKQYKTHVTAGIRKSGSLQTEYITTRDIEHLPAAVIKYLDYTGALKQKKINSFKIEFNGQIRKDSLSGWMKFSSVQYNFLNPPGRFFYMKAKMKGLPVKGFHCYDNAKAFMDIRLFSLFKVQYQEGENMNIAETVTFLNDMCCMAPATLIDKRIQWKEIDSLTVKAFFTVNDITVSATLFFNAAGQLVNFVSNDRYAQMKDNTMKQLKWSTPLKDYRGFGDYRLASYAETIYTYPEGDFCYGTFYLKGVEYNRTSY